jgi:hypothetical protein
MNDIEICLNCKKPYCNGECNDVKENKKIYIIKKTQEIKSGESKESYIYSFAAEYFSSGKNVFKAKKFEEKQAKNAIKILIERSKTNCKYEALLFEDEVKKNEKYNRKNDAFFVDINGNRLGIRNGSRKD